MLVASLAAAAFMGSYDYFTGGPASSTQASGGPHSSGSSTEQSAENSTFTTADTGSCLTWDVAKGGEVSNFQQTDCGQDHRFEVSARENLAVYPTSEFGDNAPMPSLERQAKLREELCQGATLQYLKGRFDPTGRFSIAPILPSAEAWAGGDRTMLCGLQTTNQDGTPQLTKGTVATVDQANIAERGQCLAINESDDSQALHLVPCDQPHQLETVSVVNLAEKFPDGAYPSPEAQNQFLSDHCAAAATEYVGGDENLYQSTLQPYWGSISEASWSGGTRSVNCSLMHANSGAGSFSAITGSATAGRDGLRINGEPPAQQPPRNPLRDPNKSAASATASAAPAPGN